MLRKTAPTKIKYRDLFSSEKSKLNHISLGKAICSSIDKKKD
jgi:hypothetical protein